MSKQELINELKEIGSEYLYKDIGYGGFYGDDNTFKVQGVVYEPTTEELQEMLTDYYDQNFGWVKNLTKEQLLDIL